VDSIWMQITLKTVTVNLMLVVTAVTW